MPLHSILTTILAEYPKAKIEPFGGNPLANFLRHQAADEVQNALGDLGARLTVEGSAGAGNWVMVPWISVFDPAITTLEDFFGFSELSRVSRQSDVYRSRNTSSGSRACGLKGGKSVAKS
jgi:5-methylcytosine-specific restriction enzyme MrcB-like protein